MDNANPSTNSMQPVPRERAFIETYFTTLANFHFDRAKEAAEKEKEMFKPEIGSLWMALLNGLSQLANIEKSYFTMMFVERRLLRRETIKPLYVSLTSEFLRQIHSHSSNELHGVEALSFDLAKQLQQFISARIRMIDFYEFIAKSGWNNAGNKKELMDTTVEISERFSKDFHHPVLDPLKTSFTFEVEVINTLIKLEIALSEWEFFNSYLLLRECQTKLQTWFVISPSVDSKEQSFSYKSIFRPQKRNPEIPFLYLWLLQFYELLVSKYAFYFHNSMTEHISAQDLKSLSSRMCCDYVGRLTNFHKKTDAVYVSLILEASKKRETYCGHGYNLPNIKRAPPTGMNSYPSIVGIPEPPEKMHWPNIISIINDQAHLLQQTDKIVFFYDSKLEYSYFLIKVDVLMILLLVYSTKKKERDNYITNTLIDIRASLNHNKLYHMLKPGQPKSFAK